MSDCVYEKNNDTYAMDHEPLYGFKSEIYGHITENPKLAIY